MNEEPNKEEPDALEEQTNNIAANLKYIEDNENKYDLGKQTDLIPANLKIVADVGETGLTTNISRRGLRETVSAPGTGFSYQTKAPRSSMTPAQFLAFIAVGVIILWLLAQALGTQ